MPKCKECGATKAPEDLTIEEHGVYGWVPERAADTRRLYPIRLTTAGLDGPALRRADKWLDRKVAILGPTEARNLAQWLLEAADALEDN